MSEAQAAQNFVDILLEEYLYSSISAEKSCTMCYWAAKSGMPGAVHEYGKAPRAPTGHYQRHLDTVLGFREARQQFYHMRIPGKPRHSITRGMLDMYLVPIHEAIAEECRAPGMVTRLLDASGVILEPFSGSCETAEIKTQDRRDTNDDCRE